MATCEVTGRNVLQPGRGPLFNLGLYDAERATLALVVVANALSALELWSIRSDFRSGGILDPNVLERGRSSRFPLGTVSRWIPELAATNTALLAVSLAAWHSVPELRIAAASCALAASVLLYSAIEFGRDGSDDIALIAAVSLCVALIVDREWAVEAALVCIAGTAMIAYLTAGAAKLAGESWRDGSALPAILGTTTYGSPRLGQLASHHAALSRLGGYAVIAVELLVPLSVLIGGWLLIGGLILAAGLHLGVAATMGLNRFAPAFIATYPALLWLSDRIAVGS